MENTWICDYCGEEFKTAKETNIHEAVCNARPKRVRGKIKVFFDVWQGVKLGFGFGLGLIFLSLVLIVIGLILGSAAVAIIANALGF